MPDLNAIANQGYNIYGVGGGIGNNAYSQASSGQMGALTQYGGRLQSQGYGNLLKMLQTQGRMDPRLLARQQALNARSTQVQQDQARAAGARGVGRGGLNDVLQAAIGSAGANRAANLNYQDIADSYARNQQNLGLLQQLVGQPSLDYAALGANQYGADRNAKNQSNAATAGIIGSLAGAFI